MMERGTVRIWVADKGYGWIRRDGRPDLFVHWSGIEGSGFRSLAPGQWVEFETEHTERGWHAVDVRVVGEARVTG